MLNEFTVQVFLIVVFFCGMVPPRNSGMIGLLPEMCTGKVSLGDDPSGDGTQDDTGSLQLNQRQLQIQHSDIYGYSGLGFSAGVANG